MSGIVARWTLVIFLLSAGSAHAYVDPGSGSYLFQLVLGFLLGGLYAIKVFWKDLVARFKKFFKRSTDNGQGNP